MEAPLCECHDEPMGWNKRKPSGGFWYCRVKGRERYRAWRAANLEEQRKREREYQASDPERRSAKFKQWREENPEKYKASYQNWDKANPERVRAKWKRNQQRRRALAAEAPHESWTVAEVADAFGTVCYLCGEETMPDERHADHVIPLSLGGPDVLINIRLTHPLCNMRKKDRLLEDLTDLFPGAIDRVEPVMC